MTVKTITDPITGKIHQLPITKRNPVLDIPSHSGVLAYLVSEIDIEEKKKLEKESADKDTFLGMVFVSSLQTGHRQTF